MREGIKFSQMNRREFGEWIGKRSLETSLVVLANVAMLKGQGMLKADSSGQYQGNEVLVTTETDNTLAVSDFAQEILIVGDQLVSHRGKENAVLSSVGFFAGNSIGDALSLDKPKSIKSKVGVSGLMSGKVIDLASTYYLAKQLNDPRNEEYGFSSYVGEANPLFSRNPSHTDIFIKGPILTLIGTFSAWRYPFIGRGYAGASPFIAKNNLELAQVLNTSFDIGDEIKKYIKEGQDSEFIYNYLISLMENSEK